MLRPRWTAVLLLAACSGETPSSPTSTRLSFSAAELDLGFAGFGELEIENVGDRAVGPVTIRTTGVLDAGGTLVNGVTLSADPAQVPTLNPGSAVAIRLTVTVDGSVSPGSYLASLRALTDREVAATAILRVEVLDPAVEDVVTLQFVDVPAATRQGDVQDLRLVAVRRDGSTLDDPPAAWTVVPHGAGHVDRGRFVGYAPGPVTLSARVAESTAATSLTVTPRGARRVAFEHVAGTEAAGRITSDLWVHGDHAYTGTWLGSSTTGVEPGNVLLVWRVRDATSPALTDSVKVDARTVNDVKIRADGALGVLTHEVSNDGLNGVTFFTLEDPAHPVVTSRYTEGLESGVHNAWLEGEHAYLVVDGVGAGLRVLDVSDPSAPEVVAAYYGGTSFLHDVYVRDGLAFLSHWNGGLIVLDVGNGIVGGSPTDPREVSRVSDLDGQTHNAWYWPAGGYVFVGEEDFSAPGRMHVVDFRDPTAPRRVATFAVPGQTPHNFWMDEASKILYLAWYDKGVRALDVSGELLGDLSRGGREIGVTLGDGAFRIFAPQLHREMLFAADMNAALQVVRPLN